MPAREGVCYDSGAMEKADIPIKDPTPDLSPTAGVILEAAKRVLERDGFAGLTFDSIAREAREHPSLIRYHFGSKAGLIAALVDSVFHLESVQIMESVAAQPEGDARRHALFAMHREIARRLEAYRMYYGLVPLPAQRGAARAPEVAVRVVPRPGRVVARARRRSGVARAPAVPVGVDRRPGRRASPQVQADPGIDVGPAFDLWESMVRGYLATLGEDGEGD